ncbi:hypothetical protein Q8F55_006963 [Vanrija albida]|uniref:Ribosomal RNA-processing protein 42 n=1 Tax=Vanrija albida TaxID=181172 RepID=A0ABR3PYJ9_9TREE
MAATLSPSERSYILSGLTQTPATRLDGRGLLEPRALSVAYGVAPAANGSARVRVGDTEVVAGVTLAVGEAGAKGKIEVDITPQAYPHASSSDLAQQATYYATLLSEHLLPTLPELRITEKRAFVPALHLTLVAADGGVLSALGVAARAALSDLEVPRTREIGWEGAGGDERDLAGIKGAVGGAKGKARARARGADDWDLDDGSGPLDGREDLPVLVTLFLVPASDVLFVDATPQEEAACPTRLHALVRPNGRMCGARLEGQDGIDAARVRPLFEEAQRIGIDLAAALNADLP